MGKEAVVYQYIGEYYAAVKNDETMRFNATWCDAKTISQRENKHHFNTSICGVEREKMSW